MSINSNIHWWHVAQVHCHISGYINLSKTPDVGIIVFVINRLLGQGGWFLVGQLNVSLRTEFKTPMCFKKEIQTALADSICLSKTPQLWLEQGRLHFHANKYVPMSCNNGQCVFRIIVEEVSLQFLQTVIIWLNCLEGKTSAWRLFGDIYMRRPETFS